MSYEQDYTDKNFILTNYNENKYKLIIQKVDYNNNKLKKNSFLLEKSKYKLYINNNKTLFIEHINNNNKIICIHYTNLLNNNNKKSLHKFLYMLKL